MSRLFRPARGNWSTLAWPVWLCGAAVLVGLTLVTGAWTSAAILAVLVVLVAGLRLRQRRPKVPGA